MQLDKEALGGKAEDWTGQVANDARSWMYDLWECVALRKACEERRCCYCCCCCCCLGGISVHGLGGKKTGGNIRRENKAFTGPTLTFCHPHRHEHPVTRRREDLMNGGRQIGSVQARNGKDQEDSDCTIPFQEDINRCRHLPVGRSLMTRSVWQGSGHSD